ncbi:DedA family protein [Microbacterium aureliae]
MIDDALAHIAASPWALPLLYALVVGDTLLVVLPGEAAVTAFGALAVTVGDPALVAVIAVAAVGAFTGDAACYVLGRTVGLHRWRWMRAARTQRAFAWARSRMQARLGAVLFTARFIPFARLAVNLTAGATRMPASRHLAIAGLAATAWAAYQALVGAIVARVVPGGPLVAVGVSILVAVALGIALDASLTRATRPPRA